MGSSQESWRGCAGLSARCVRVACVAYTEAAWHACGVHRRSVACVWRVRGVRRGSVTCPWRLKTQHDAHLAFAEAAWHARGVLVACAWLWWRRDNHNHISRKFVCETGFSDCPRFPGL